MEFISVDSTIKGSKDELFLKAKSWLVHEFKSANDVIQLSDKEAGKLIGKGYFEYIHDGGLFGYNTIDKIWFTVTINVKQDKDRIIISELSHEGTYESARKKAPNYGSLDEEKPPSSIECTKKQFAKIKDSAKESSNNFIKSFNAYMHSDSKIAKDEF
jgi:hypothetical protein